VFAGPYASQLLGDMGADVIKIEAPDGDLTRSAGPRANPGMPANFMQLNRNKRAIALDLKTDGGARALRKLIRKADVFVHNMRPEPLARLGFDYAQVKKLKPDIVYCNIWGFGRAGRYAGRPAYDDVIQAASGLVALEAFGGKPARYVPSLIADKTTGLFAAYAIATALFHQLKTGDDVREHGVLHHDRASLGRELHSGPGPRRIEAPRNAVALALCDGGRVYLRPSGQRPALARVPQIGWPRGYLGQPGRGDPRHPV